MPNETFTTNWIVESENAALFRNLAEQFGYTTADTGKPGDIIAMGSAEAEISQGCIGIAVSGPTDPEKYMDFQDAYSEATDQLRNSRKEVREG